jgi:hypothetical protein
MEPVARIRRVRVPSDRTWIVAFSPIARTGKSWMCTFEKYAKKKEKNV